MAISILKGSINEFRVYNGVLSDSEITANNIADTFAGIGVGNPSISRATLCMLVKQRF